MSGNITKSYQEFKDIFNNLNSTKAYQPLIIRTLAESYPDLLSKGKIAGKIREFYHNGDSYEQYNIWSNLSDRLGLIREQNGFYGLNTEPLRSEQLHDLINLSKQKIIQAENSDRMQFHQISQQSTITPTISDQNKNTINNNSNMQQTNQEDDETDSDIEDETDSVELLEENYFLIKINVNQQDRINVNRLKDYGLNLSKREKRTCNIAEGETHKAILFDIKGGYVRIWGYSDMTYSARPSYGETHLKVINFKPMSLTEDGQIEPQWLRRELTRQSMFTNKKIIDIPKNDYANILKSCVPELEFSKSKTEELLDEDQREIQYWNDVELEIPNKETLERGINKITDELLIDRRTIEEIVINLASGRNVLLAGPIGTGKTRLSEMIPRIFWSSSVEDLGYDAKIYTASYEWNVTDVIGGIVPRMFGDKPTYQIQYGCVVETVRESWQEKNRDNLDTGYRGTWLVIDEFNRAEIDKAFGQLFTSLETRSLRIPDTKRPELIEMKIPKDYRIIGTLNTSDKHYLFKLSDALKRRFAYIEVKSPLKSESEKEIFYALKNAIEELSQEKFSSMINLDHLTKKLSDIQTNPELVAAMRSAYEILSFIRMIKDMGPAILKSMYQTMLVGTQIGGYNDNVLDIAINGNLIPQLERIQSTNIEIISKFCFYDLHSFFRQMYDAQDEDMRQKYTNDFEYYLQFLGISEIEMLKEKYSKKNIEPEAWAMILEKWNVQKPRSGLPRKLPIFNSSLEELKKTFEFL